MRGRGLRDALIAGTLALLAALAVTLVLLKLGNADPVQAASALWRGSVGTRRTFGESLIRATPLLIIAIGLVPSLRAGLFNIGAPGQIGLGALAATLVSLWLADTPPWMLIPLAAIAAALGGALAALVPAVLRARWQINEIITTLAFNFLVLYLLSWLLNGPIQGDYANLPQSDPLPPNSKLPILIPGTRAHTGLIVALLAVPLLWAFDRSRAGYRLRLFGGNRRLAAQAGVSEVRLLVLVMCIGGAAAGLAGWMQVSAVDHRLYPTVAAPIGYTGFFTALLGGLHPLGILVAALLLGILVKGGDSLQVGAGVSPEIIQALLGVILLLYAGRSVLMLRRST